MASVVEITSSSTTELLKNSSFHQKFYDLNKDIPAALAEDSDIIKEKCKSAVKRISSSSSIFLVAHEDDEDIILPGNCASRGNISHHDSVKSVGDIIGSGACSEVREYYFVIEENVQDDNEKDDNEKDDNEKDDNEKDDNEKDDNEKDDNSKLKTAHSRRSSLASQLSSTGENTYAMKTLKHDLSRSTKISGLVDLTIEAHFLARLSHPNIVNLLSTGGEPGSPSFFIVIERISCTLAEVIKKCRFQRRRMKSIGVNKYGEKMDKIQTKIELRYEFNNRINILRQIASAVRYLHSHSILHRDLKPQNMGEDENGTIKLFDFGTCKELKEDLSKKGNNKYYGTKRIGTMRYMSPEVATSTLYGLPADVYSFALVAWFVLHLQEPFAGFTSDDLLKVHEKRRRPRIKKNMPKDIRQVLLKSGWDNDPEKRPTMEEMYSTLDGVLQSSSS